MLGQARGLLRATKLQLKGKGGIVDLRSGDAVQVLGFALRKAGEDVEFSLADEAMDSLRDRLERCHENENPQASAKAVLEGWLASSSSCISVGAAPHETDFGSGSEGRIPRDRNA